MCQKRKAWRGYARFLVVMILAPACIAGCSGKDETDAQEQGKRPVRVETVSVRSRVFLERVRGIGTIRAAKAVEIRPEIAGILVQVNAEEGRRVKEGDLLFVLEDNALRRRLDEQKRALDAARARLENVRSTHRRLRSLWERRVIAKERWDQVQSQMEVARAEVRRLEAAVQVVRERLEDTRVQAPFAGVLSERLVDPGDLVQQGQPLVRLYRDGGTEADFSVTGRHAGRVNTGQRAEVAVDAYPEQTFSGRVVFVSPDLDPKTREFQVTAQVEDPDQRLKPGMFARVAVVVSRREDRAAVPEECLVPVRDGYAVFVVEEDRARRRPVDIGLRRAGTVEIAEGLQPGERVVRTGHLRLEDGDAVQSASPSSGE